MRGSSRSSRSTGGRWRAHDRRAAKLVTAALLCLLCLFAPPATAQEKPGLGGAAGDGATPEPKQPTSAGEIAARRAALAAELAAHEQALAAARDDAARGRLEEVGNRLRDIDSLLRRQDELATAGPALEPSQSDLPLDGPASIFLLNRLYEARHDAEQRRSWLAEALAASRDALAVAKEKFEEAETKRREARSALETAADPVAKRRAEQALQLRQLASRAAQERVHLRTLETRIASGELEAVGDVSDLEARIAEVRDAIEGGDGAAEEGFAALTEAEGALRRERQEAERSLATVELRLEAAQQRFSRQASPSPDLLEQVEALRATRDAMRERISLLEARLERIDERRELLRQWQAVLRREGRREELVSREDALAERIRALDQAELHAVGLERDLLRRLEGIESRMAGLPSAGSGSRAALEEQRAALARALDAVREETSLLAAEERLARRVLGAHQERTGGVDLLEYAVHGARALRDVWSYEITAVDDAPITVGSLVLALLLFGAGMWAARHGSAFVGRFATERFRLDAGAAHALQTLSFYVLLVSFTLLALRAVHFPLTAFTVLGGALAIGIGFGSQNVMNNFISGLILMLERPVRAGDVVEVDANQGTIERIGARSTQIRSVDGRHLVVPNSFFLENNVVNWTLSDDLIRTSVLVGVIYGSPTRLVEQLIRKVVDEDSEVLSSPEPILLFDEFGDNSLNFEVHFWVRARSAMAMRKVQSRVRFRIDDLFREHELVIAFPQRDVHLDSASPIEVRLVNGSGQPPDPAGG